MRVCRGIVMTIALCFVFSAFFSIAVFANDEINTRINSEIDNEAEVVSAIELLDLNRADLDALIDENDSSEYVYSGMGVPQLKAYRAASLKDMGELQLTTGFTRERITTFSKTKSVEGFGKEGVLVGMYVFHFETKVSPVGERVESIIVSRDNVTEIGASGIYSETINFDYIGENYVLLVTLDPETQTQVIRLFNVCRKEVTTRDLLENVEINFFEKEEELEIQDLVPKLTDFGF